MIDDELSTAIRDALKRVLTGRERVPGDLPYPPSVYGYVVASAFPEEDLKRFEWTRQGRDLARAVRQVYIAGWFAGRECDAQITRQLTAWFRPTGRHPYVGVSVCLVCDQPPDASWHEETP